MSGIPDWFWKVLSGSIIPIVGWAIATHVENSNQNLRLGRIEQQIVATEQSLSKQDDSISQTKQDIEILKVKIDYISNNVESIKKMMEEDRRK